MELEPHEYRFFGKSNGVMLLRTALELKNEYTGSDITLTDLRHGQKPPLQNLRMEFWTLRPLYFTHVNLYLPLLHRPTF
ncbi:hypothetical protein BDZ97DRAFT_1877960, partial [Flammula alnicola]